MKKPRGRPRHEPSAKDRQLVEILAGFGIPLDKVSQVIGISRFTLLDRYRAEIDRGAATVEAKLVGNLLRIASGSDGAALKAISFALQMRFGWRTPPLGNGDEPPALELGKKEAAQLAARTAGQGSDWGDDLDPHPARPN